jgi:hypothetical protein
MAAGPVEWRPVERCIRCSTGLLHRAGSWQCAKGTALSAKRIEHRVGRFALCAMHKGAESLALCAMPYALCAQRAES